MLAGCMATLLVAGPAFTADRNGPSADLRESLLAVMHENGIPGLAAAVIVDDTPVWVDALGQADIASARAMTGATVMNIASVTKLVTSTAVLRLYEQGELDLDDEVNAYLPFRLTHPAAPGGAITIRQLLTHTAGIDDSDAYIRGYACGDPATSLEAWLRAYLLPGGESYDDGNFTDTPPGSTFKYSNVGYGLLGLVVERITGTGFDEHTRRAIFEPLGMEDTYWYIRDVPSGAHATPYWLAAPGAEPDPEDRVLLPDRPFADDEMVPLCLYSFYNYPDGLVRTTIGDLVRFMIAVQPGGDAGNKLLSAETRAEVFSNQLTGVDAQDRVQGLGWRQVESSRFGRMWGHGGADPGVRAHVLHRPADGVSIVVMANRLVTSELRPVIELLFGEGEKQPGNH
jgi:CubicO group peptidase (beta-lactamase class C family)